MNCQIGIKTYINYCPCQDLKIFQRDACMTWTLDNGTIVLQNFVNKDEACFEDYEYLFVTFFKRIVQLTRLITGAMITLILFGI